MNLQALVLVLLVSQLNCQYNGLYTDQYLTTSDDSTDNGSPQREFTLIQDSHYYYLYTYISTTSNAYPIGPLALPFLIGLYTNTTLISSNCSQFLDFSGFCSEFMCGNTSQTLKTLNLPYFDAVGDPSSFTLYLSSDVDVNVSGIVNSNCTTGATSSYGSSTNGLLGMGTSGVNSTTPAFSAYFSIYLANDPFNNRLLFYFDSNKSQSSTPIATLQSDNNWLVNGVSGIQVGNQVLNTSNISLIFDINSQGILVPQNIFDFIKNNLLPDGTCLGFGDENTSDHSDTYYLSDADQLNCFYPTENLTSFSTIVLWVGTQAITIPPEVYTEQGSTTKDQMSLYLITSSSQYYVSPSYQNTIILGSSLMKYYYTVFDGRDGENTISMYLANHQPVPVTNTSTTPLPNTSTSGSSNLLVILLAIAVGVLLVLCLISSIWLCVIKRRPLHERKKSEREVGLVDVETTVISSNQTRL